jgi:hypothetical protein
MMLRASLSRLTSDGQMSDDDAVCLLVKREADLVVQVAGAVAFVDHGVRVPSDGDVLPTELADLETLAFVVIHGGTPP